MNVTENNRIILNSEFSNIRGHYDEDEDAIYLESDIDGKGVYGVEELKYNSSWEWLMPVYKEINTHPDITIDNNFHLSRIREYILDGNIKEAFLEIVELIVWYNENK